MSKTITDPKLAAAELSSIVANTESIAFFGGAGVSTASGIPEFRSPNGLCNQKFDYPPEEMLSHDFYLYHQREFFDFYRSCMIALDAKPNQAHYKLAELEREGKITGVVTQNIDGLHQMAGSKKVFELHGSVHRNICTVCDEVYSAEWVMGKVGVPSCDKCHAVVKPDVVLYGESLDQRTMIGAIEAISAADVLIVGGTSLVVYPAAGLVRYFQGSKLIICNLEPTPQDAYADLVCACDIAAAFDF